uniref:Exostosin GT47 domain-containing protein n=1 Tax=Leersia perrieri TaxID=77586 RepID=A0A0D9XM92_9ORYZ
MPNPLSIPFFLFSVAIAAAAAAAAVAVSGDANQPDPCAGRRIHIRRLPPRFNTHLLRHCDAAFPLADPSSPATSSPPCSSLSNHGLGPRTHPTTHSWYRTDERLLEVFFHRRIAEHDCLVADPSAADAVFVPYYAALDSLPFVLDPSLLDSSSIHGADLADFLSRDSPRVLARRHGHDHFLVIAGSAWDYSQPPAMGIWGTTSLLRLPALENFTFLTAEARSWPWQEHAVPRATAFHPATMPRLRSWLSRAARSRRAALMLFAGGVSRPSRPNIRGSILAECANLTASGGAGDCVVVDCSGGKCDHDPIRYMVPMLHAKFCLQPPGDTPTRRSTFDAIIAGCVPVFFEDAAARRQYGWHLPPARYGEFSVYINKEAVVFGGVKIGETLAAVNETEVRRMRERVLEMAPRVIYRRHGSLPEMRETTKDAFDLAVDGALRRIRKRVQALEDGMPERIYSMEDDAVAF